MLFNQLEKLSSFKSCCTKFQELAGKYGREVAMLCFISCDIYKTDLVFDPYVFEKFDSQQDFKLVEYTHSQLILLIIGEEPQYAFRFDQVEVVTKFDILTVFILIFKSFFFLQLDYPKKRNKFYKFFELVFSIDKSMSKSAIPVSVSSYYLNLQR